VETRNPGTIRLWNNNNYRTNSSWCKEVDLAGQTKRNIIVNRVIVIRVIIITDIDNSGVVMSQAKHVIQMMFETLVDN